MAFLPGLFAGLGGGAAAGAGLTATQILTMASTAASIVGSAASAKASSDAALINARVAKNQGQQALEQGALAASEATRRSRQAAGQARAAALESGLGLEGSPLDVVGQIERQGQMDALTAVYEGKVAASGRKVDAQLSQRRARSEQTAGIIGAGTRAMGGFMDYYRRGSELSV